MKKSIKYIAIVLILFSFGCTKFLDVNHDPNNPEDVNVELIFPAAVTSTASVLGSYGLMLGQIWSQHWTSDANAPSYQNEDSYAVNAGDYNYDIGIWRGLYAGALMDYEQVRNKAMADSNWTYYLMGTLMQCYTYHVLADLFEDIPISEALQLEPPHYELGTDVYDTLIARIDYAMSKDLTADGNQKPGNDDLLFAGNMDDWIAFGNTLKLKMYLRQADARPEIAQAGITELYNSGATFLDKDIVYDYFTDELDRDNFMHAMEFRGGSTNIRASKTLLDYLDEKGDPRIDYIYVAPASGHDGYFQGDFRNVYSHPDDAEPSVSVPRVTPLMPFYFFTKAEILFMQAEIALRGWGEGDPKELYENAIKADIDRLHTIFSTEISDGDLTQISEDNISDMLTVDYVFPINGTFDDKLEAIIVQKWIAMANIQGLEAFFEHNRTGYPTECLTLISDENFESDYKVGQFMIAVNGVLSAPIYFPKRLLFSSTEQNRNPHTPEVKSLNKPIWWDYQY